MLEILYYIFIFPVEQVLEWALFTLFKATKNYGVSIILLSFVMQLFMLKLTFYFDKKAASFGAVLEWALFTLFKATKNYGVSIILLSFVMQLFMLKLTFYFDKKAASFGALKAQCDSKIKEFKRVFKGAELQSYIRTLYKQKHFHPIFALFGLGGLALQIPFFIAMIHLVENAEYLQSVRFLWIDDLSKPDSIMLFGLSIHILPLLMTAFTLINVFYSSKELGARVRFLWIDDLSKPDSIMLFGLSIHILPLLMTAFTLINVFYSSKELGARIQGSLIALLFLVLLYSMPSALVLYWTCNMAFALFKEIFKQCRDKRHSVLSDKIGSASPYSLRRMSNTPHSQDLHNPNFSSQSLECQTKSNNSNLNQDTRIVDSLSCHTEQSEVSKKRDSNNLSCHTEQSEVSKKRDSNNIESTKSDSNNANSSKNTKLSGKAIQPQGKLKTLFFNIFTPHTAIDSKTYTTYRNISILAILNICFMICVFSPYALYSSDVSQFDINQTYQTLGALFGFFILSSFGFIYFTSFFYKTRLLKIGVYGVSVILCIGIIYTFVLTGDYGAMDHFIFQKLNFANPDLRLQKYLYFILTLCFFVIFCLFMMKWLKQIWSVLFATLFIVGGYYCVHIAYSIQDYVKYSHTQNIQDSNDMQPYEKELFSYSKTEKNIVVMVLDMFSGSHMHPLLEQFPEFKTQLDGFVLFDNAISTTNSTIHSIATLIGGEHYAVYNMNARKDNLADSITEAFGVMGDTFVKNGYDVGYFMADLSTRFDKVKTYNNNITLIQNARAYASYYYNSNPLIKEKMGEQILAKKDGAKFLLLHTGLFRFAPELFFRPRIYNGGVWLLGDENSLNHQAALEFASSFYAFTHLHNTESKKPTFKYLHSLMTHLPYTLSFQNGECVPFTQDSIFDKYPHKDMMNYIVKENEVAYFQHYDTEVCALKYLSDFVKWLKENGIYNNTQIFVVSDHSGFDDIGIPYSVSQREHRPSSLFLFKDFNTSGELKIDSRLMTNYDSPSIFCENIPNGGGVSQCANKYS